MEIKCRKRASRKLKFVRAIRALLYIIVGSCHLYGNSLLTVITRLNPFTERELNPGRRSQEPTPYYYTNQADIEYDCNPKMIYNDIFSTQLNAACNRNS